MILNFGILVQNPIRVIILSRLKGKPGAFTLGERFGVINIWDKKTKTSQNIRAGQVTTGYIHISTTIAPIEHEKQNVPSDFTCTVKNTQFPITLPV